MYSWFCKFRRKIMATQKCLTPKSSSFALHLTTLDIAGTAPRQKCMTESVFRMKPHSYSFVDYSSP